MSRGTEVDLGPGHIMSDGDLGPLAKKGHSPPPTFRPMSIVAKRSLASVSADLILNFGTPLLSMERMKLGTSNLTSLGYLIGNSPARLTEGLREVSYDYPVRPSNV